MEEICEGKDYSFPREEEKVLKFWEEIDAFHTQLKKTEGLPEYIFYDGPPFATGLPHYGHILAGTIKDIITRFQTMMGHHVTRRFGWDCHGLPVEYEIDQKFNIKTRDQVVGENGMGIAKYNEECRSIVMRYSSDWAQIITRMGRWIDFENDYKTLDPEFMESVWWVFSELHRKGLVYRGYKVMPYSTGCNTPLSNFEAGLNYKDVSDPAVVVSFPLVDDSDGAALLAWTTTPWTLPSNLALCVNAAFVYIKVKDRQTGAVYILAESRVSQLPSKKKGKSAPPEAAKPSQPNADGPPAASGSKKEPEKKGGAGGKGGKKGKGGGDAVAAAAEIAKATVDESAYEILGRMKGKDLVGKKYTPIFPYFEELAKVAFKVCSDDYVTDDSGTGVVHQAPAYGEDDFRVCLAHGIIEKGKEVPNPVDDGGCFTAAVPEFQGRYVKEADKDIMAHLKAKGRLVSSGTLVHSYPFCWRSDTPLIYRAVPSWFVAVESIKERLLANNQLTYWVPDYVKAKRFHNWLENARDWSVSRSRFWGTPLPIWLSDDGEEMVVIGSVDELEKLSGIRVTDLHRDKIDHITIPSKQGKGELKRVEDVFDCWFESGSMPYGYIHYPFENQKLFETNFPGDFVAEGLDQTRGWFYTLMVLSTALFDKPAFKNLICNGLVLAEDGKKMSKRLKNYPDPMTVVTEYGADALRLYLINSPVVRAEPLRFKKEGVFSVVKDVFLPWYNAYRFLVQNAIRLEAEGHGPFSPLPPSDLRNSTNVLDQWIQSASLSLAQFVRAEMEAYRLYTVVPYLLRFIDNLTNIYVRFNRKRLKARTNLDNCRVALSTLFHVLLTVCKAMSPFTPFFTENMYRNLRKALGPDADDSIHFCRFPPIDGTADERIETSVLRMQTVIDLARNIRERHNKPTKTPLRGMVVVHPDKEFLEDIAGVLREYVAEELNVRTITPCNDPLQYATLRAEPDFSVLGKRLGSAMGSVAKAVKGMDTEAIQAYEKSGSFTVGDHVLGQGEIKILRDFRPPPGIDPADLGAAGDGEVLVVLDLRPDTDLLDAGAAREIVNRVQKLRKKIGLEPSDAVDVFIDIFERDDPTTLRRVILSEDTYIRESLGQPILPLTSCPAHAVVIGGDTFSGVAGGAFSITITRQSLSFVADTLNSVCQGNEDHATAVRTLLLSRDPSNLRTEVGRGNGSLHVVVDGHKAVEVQQGEHFHLSVSEHITALRA